VLSVEKLNLRLELRDFLAVHTRIERDVAVVVVVVAAALLPGVVIVVAMCNLHINIFVAVLCSVSVD